MGETLNIDRGGKDQNPVRDWDAPDDANDHKANFTVDALCFPHPAPAEPRRHTEEPRQLRLLKLKNNLSELAESQNGALGRLLPALLCGEESAFQVFWRESCRLSDDQLRESQALARRIAAEELEHERLLQDLRDCCPVPDDLAGILAESA